ncbi:hypothetical protein Efla_001755 [Eimeria flavescens]
MLWASLRQITTNFNDLYDGATSAALMIILAPVLDEERARVQEAQWSEGPQCLGGLFDFPAYFSFLLALQSMAECKSDDSPSGTGDCDAHLEKSQPEAVTSINGRVRDKLKKFERTHRDSAGELKASALRPKATQRTLTSFPSAVSEKKVRELESALRHREELIRSLQGAIAQRESDLSFVLKEKFQLSKEIVLSRSAAQACLSTSQGTQRMSSAETSADSLGEKSAAAECGMTPDLSPFHSYVSAKQTQQECDESIKREAINQQLDQCHEEQLFEALLEPDAQEINLAETAEQHAADGVPDVEQGEASGTAESSQHQQGKFAIPRGASLKGQLDGNNYLPSSGCSISKSVKFDEKEHGNAARSASPPIASHVHIDPTFTEVTRTSLADAAAYLMSNKWRLRSSENNEEGVAASSPSARASDGIPASRISVRDAKKTESGNSDPYGSADEADERCTLTNCPPQEWKATESSTTPNSLRVQTQARIDAEAETSDVLAMHEELCLKIDFLQKAFEEICQELDAVRNENRVLARNASADRAAPTLKVPESSTPSKANVTRKEDVCDAALRLDKENAPALPQYMDNGGEFDERRLLGGEGGQQTSYEDNSAKQPEENNGRLQQTLERIESLLQQTQCWHQEGRCRSEGELLAVQNELEKAQRQVGMLEERCKILQDVNDRTWRMLEALIFTIGEQAGSTTVECS